MQHSKVYPYSFNKANEYGETDAYHESNKINCACVAAIDKAIEATRDGYNYDLKSALASVTEEYGAERVNWLLAATIRQKEHDGRLSAANKAWAQTYPVPEDGYHFLHTHPAVLDGFANYARQQDTEKDNPLKNAELSLEQNYNSIDGIINNLPITVEMQSAVISNYENMDAFVGQDDKVYLGRRANYDNHGHYDNSDDSLVFISDNAKIYGMLYGSGCILSQAEALAYEVYSRADYEEWIRLLDSVLKDFTKKPGHEFLFDGEPFIPLDRLQEITPVRPYKEFSSERMSEPLFGEMPKLHKYENVDVIAALESVMKLNTKHYQNDFEIDKRIIMRAALSEQPEDKNLLWLSRPSGTECFRESDVFIKDFAPHNSWRYYAEQTKDKILAYSVALSGVEDGKAMGTLYALDYEKSVERVNTAAQPCATVRFEYSDGSTQEVPVKDRKNANHSGKEVLTVHYLPEDASLLKGILTREQADRSKLRPASFNRHLVLLDRAINKESSVMEKLKEAKQAVKPAEPPKPGRNKDKGIEL